MSINGADRERILTFYQRKQKGAIANLLGFEIEDIKLEMPFGGSFIDLYGVYVERRLEVYFEVQLNTSDAKHYKKIISIINGIQEGIIVWIATKFQQEHLRSIQMELQGKRQKYINFYAVELAPEVLVLLSQLDAQYKLHVLDNLGLLDQVKNPMHLVYKIEQIPKTFVGRAIMCERVYNFERSEDIVEYTMKRLREKVSFYPNVHFERRPKKGDLSISIGAGKDGISFICSTKNRYKQAFVKLYFAKHRNKVYELFQTHLPSLQQQIHSEIVYRNREIAYYFKPHNELDSTIDQIAETLKRMIYYFTPYLYRKNNA